jgi:hypothetical protein
MRRTTTLKITDMKAIRTLVQSRLQARGWSHQTLAETLTPHNPRKTLAKVKALLEEERHIPNLLDAVCRVLQIHRGEREAAETEDRRVYRQLVMDQQRRHFRPHLWTEVVPGFQRPLFMGADVFRKTELPAALLALEDEHEIIDRIGRFVAAHFCSSALRIEKWEVQLFLYRRSFDLAYRFTPSGDFLTKVEQPIIAPMHRLVVH